MVHPIAPKNNVYKEFQIQLKSYLSPQRTISSLNQIDSESWCQETIFFPRGFESKNIPDQNGKNDFISIPPTMHLLIQ